MTFAGTTEGTDLFDIADRCGAVVPEGLLDEFAVDSYAGVPSPARIIFTLINTLHGGVGTWHLDLEMEERDAHSRNQDTSEWDTFGILLSGNPCDFLQRTKGFDHQKRSVFIRVLCAFRCMAKQAHAPPKTHS